MGVEAGMWKRSIALTLLPLSLLGTAGGTADLVVHEWGTFTSVAGRSGHAVEWAPFSGAPDLPGFVTVLNPASAKTGFRGPLPPLRATVRMETPVLYFYVNEEQTVDVTVNFPQGLITEWYPQAIVPPGPGGAPLARANGRITWNDVKVSPFPRGSFPVEPGKSHYYAARETDASPVRVADQHEKFLFYRGVGGFPVPVAARVSKDGAIAVESTGAETIEQYVLFERQGDRLGYRIASDTSPGFLVERPALDGSLDALGADLETMLTAQGLYAKEAAAMVETWRDSWFEEGTRLLYIVPRASVDGILPLRIDPPPAETVRVFVGRLEIITPERQTEVSAALSANDEAALEKHGRFLDPILQRLGIAPGVETRPASARR